MFFQKVLNGIDAVYQDPISAVVGIGSSLIGASATKNAADAAQEGAEAAAQVQWDMYDQSREDLTPWREVGQSALYQLADLYGLAYPEVAADGGTDQTQTTSQTASTQTGGAPVYGDFYQPAWDQVTEGTDYSRLNMPPQGELLNTQNQLYNQAMSDWLAGGGQIPTAQAPTTAESPEDRRQNAFANFYQSPDYQFRLDEGNKAIERSAAAKGRALSGATVKDLINYSGNLASGEFQNYKNSLANLAGIGQTTSQNLASLGQGYAANAGQALQNAGAARASGYLGVGNTLNNAINNYQRMQALNTGVGAPPFNPYSSAPMNALTGASYGTTPFSQQSYMLAQQDFGF